MIDFASDLDTLSPEEFVAGLMRGDRASRKLGYSADAATLAVTGIRGTVDTAETARLHEFARGFADGMTGDPGRRDDESYAFSASYAKGWRQGDDEDRLRTYPAVRR